MLSGCMMQPARSCVDALQGPKPVSTALVAFIPVQHALMLTPSYLPGPDLKTVPCQNASMVMHLSDAIRFEVHNDAQVDPGLGQ